MTLTEIADVWESLSGRPLVHGSLAEAFAIEIERRTFEEAALIADELAVQKKRRYADPDTAKAIAARIRQRMALNESVASKEENGNAATDPRI